MTWFTPTRKVSFGLVMLTVSLLLLGDLIGVMPNEDRGLLEGRKKFCESLAAPVPDGCLPAENKIYALITVGGVPLPALIAELGPLP